MRQKRQFRGFLPIVSHTVKCFVFEMENEEEKYVIQSSNQMDYYLSHRLSLCSGNDKISSQKLESRSDLR